MRRFCLVLCAVLIGSSSVLAESYASLNEKGNEAFSKGDYKTALDFYQRAQIERPETPPLYYNHANALTETKGFEEAVEEYQKALKTNDTVLLARTNYNIGNSHFLQGSYARAIDAYQKALELNPDDLDTKYNLELTRKRLAEQRSKHQPQQNNQGQQPRPDEKSDQQKQSLEPQEDEKGQPQQDQNKREPQRQPNKDQMSKEDALRILRALKEGERRNLMHKKTLEAYQGKDW